VQGSLQSQLPCIVRIISEKEVKMNHAETETSLPWFVKAANKVTEWVALIGSFGNVLIIFAVCFEVIMRYVFDKPTIWSVEVSSYLLLLVIFTATAYTLQTDGHVRVDIITIRLPDKPRTCLSIITSFLTLLFTSIATWHAAALAFTAFSKGWEWEEWNIPIFPIYMIIPLGTLLLSCQAVAKIVLDIKALRQGG
jgi:TRAP-type mannitol/chloroaromatic compound transport system permease small subunit